MKEATAEWVDTMERLIEAVEKLDASVQSASTMQMSAQAEIAEARNIANRIVATVESEREIELQRRLEEAEAKIAEAESKLAELSAGAGRKTVAAGVAAMVAKQGVAVESLHANSIDAALVGLSIEQRIAVKAELLRAGVIG